MIDVAVVNAFILYNLLNVQAGQKPISENDFRDKLVLQTIYKYGRNKQECVIPVLTAIHYIPTTV